MSSVSEKSLMFTFVLRLPKPSSITLVEDLMRCSTECGLQADFHFLDSKLDEPVVSNGNVAVISVVSPNAITPELLSDLDGVLCDYGCAIYDIEHRSDNKQENNGDYNKVMFRVGCPQNVKLASLYLGSSGGESVERASCARGLQVVGWTHGAEITVRWWNALDRPNGKSLVVFGLSHVLYPCDVLDEVLKEAGQECLPACTEASKAEDNGTQRRREGKVARLKGVSADVVQNVIKRLDFTPGAELICAVLKRMGFRMAILSNTGMHEIAEHAKRQLGIDYAITRGVEVAHGAFTGRYEGESNDIQFRKMDVLKLMADREGIEYKNVIVVGEMLRGLKAGNAHQTLETFGPNVYFNSDKLKDLTIVLYLLGFSGTDVSALKNKRKTDAVETKCANPSWDQTPPAKRFKVQVSAKSHDPGLLKRILAPLSASRNLRIETVRQCSLQDGGMCLGVDVCAKAEDSERPLKELLFSCTKERMKILDVAEPVAHVPASPNAWAVNYTNRYLVTIVQQPQISSDTLHAVFGALHSKAVNCVSMQPLSIDGLAAMQITACLPADLPTSDFSNLMAEISRNHEVDVAVQRDDVDRWMRRLVVFDMDSTLIQHEVIDELAKFAGVEAEVSAITEAAMRGELDFFESLKSRVSYLKGHNAQELFAKVKAGLIFTPGAKKLCSTLKRLGYKLAVISGGFLPVAQEVQRHLGLDYAFANTLEVDADTGLLTGRTSGPVVTPERKRALLATIANVEGCDVQQTIAVGDGSNDIPMLHTAGLGIAFCAKPKVQAAAQFRINQKDLSTVLFLIGVSEHAAAHIAVGPSVADLERERAL
jgi:phosphoserine phosphatase SerB